MQVLIIVLGEVYEASVVAKDELNHVRATVQTEGLPNKSLEMAAEEIRQIECRNIFGIRAETINTIIEGEAVWASYTIDTRFREDCIKLSARPAVAISYDNLIIVRLHLLQLRPYRGRN
ncbi:hypothetical protein GCM10007874_31050 [Labrys miyagiensis]|uniref:Uncharacterized protein n=1 Tax=Labrys miyagiensis TaxID=346912 RepID=A0ABQ6CIB6_9HYPH|nr:hypothetical protein [Labrys miyagiensis]GLS20088.1 hypothetical protein GCM10007874_31050 [Labrys miyagiensis]